LRGYAFWGSDVFARLKGMFALVIYDARRRELIAARDRFGMKPLYYATNRNGQICFASEVRALMKLFPTGPTLGGIAAYLRVGACPEHELLLEGISSLPAAHFLTLAPDGAKKSGCYWVPNPWPSARPSAAIPPTVRIRQLLEKSVEEHLLADVPVASFLSGGIDSSLITALAARLASGRLATFSVGFTDYDFDETAGAEIVARRYHTVHTRLELSEETAIGMVTEAVGVMDLPSICRCATWCRA
jgi:asparagine synthase (glutamine-hydrolysing)